MGRRALTAVAVLLAVTLSGCQDGSEPELQPDGPPPGPSTGPSGVAGGWHRVTLDGVAVRVPARWVVQDTSACEFPWPRVGPADPCDPDGPGAALYASATFDPAAGPGELTRSDGRVGGYVHPDREHALWVSAGRRSVVEQVLASARPSR